MPHQMRIEHRASGERGFAAKQEWFNAGFLFSEIFPYR